MSGRDDASRPRAAVLAALLVLSIAGCGEQTLDDEELESTLKRQLDTSAGVTSRSVACPDDIVIERGKVFSCTLVAPDGDEVRVDVRLTDDEGGFDAEYPRRQQFR